ncbi:MAG: BON domain-containing protein [Terracidiphilus sp.]|nr:BON domain-containing protein [Terracidiphilus sp.]
MIRPFLKRVFPQALALTAILALGTAFALAQDAAPTPGQRSDGQIEMDVVHALDASQALKNDLITAATIQSQVTLAGTVSSQASKELAGSIAGQVAGVTKVNNNLKVGNPQQAQDAQPAPSADSGDAQQAAASQPDYGPVPAPQAYPQQNQNQDQDQQQAPYPPARPQYVPNSQGQQQQRANNPQPVYETPKGPVTIPQGTLLQVRTSEPVDGKRAKDGTPVQFTVIQDVAFGGVLAIPRGATVHGVVTESKKSGDLGGSPVLSLTLTSLDLGGQSYALDTDQFKVKGPNKAGRTASSAIGGALLGAIIGGAVGGGEGAAIGAGAGAAGGTAASAASPNTSVWIPSEALVDFHLNTPLTVNPVNAQEAARLSQGLYQGGPSLYRREPSPYGSPYAARYPYYGYPPVYYRPYYVTGGYYYWR